MKTYISLKINANINLTILFPSQFDAISIAGTTFNKRKINIMLYHIIFSIVLVFSSPLLFPSIFSGVSNKPAAASVDIKNFIKTKYAISICNGTAALHVALLALGIKSKDEVITPTFTYIATANSINYVGASVKFVDSKISSWQIDEDKIIESIL